MKSLKNKASRFFKDSPSQDEKVANSERGATDFDAGIHGRSVRQRPSRFFLRKGDKTGKELPSPLSKAPASTVATSNASEDRKGGAILHEGVTSGYGNVLPIPVAQFEPSDMPEPPSAPSSTRSSIRPETKQPKPQPSFATLRSKRSLFFRSNNNSQASLPPPPPVPQIPVDPQVAQNRQSALTPLHSTRNSARNSRSSFVGLQNGSVTVSRPVLLPQYSSLPIPENPVIVPFTKPSGPPPDRPDRPDSLDEDIIAFMQQSGMRMVLQTSNRVSGSTASSSTPRSQSSSIEARLGLPCGYGRSRNTSLDSPLAARFPIDVLQPLQVRDSAGSITVSRFSEFVKAEQGGYASDGVDEGDRELGPIEQYDASKEGDWRLEKRVSRGPNGNAGMLFRDRWGAFHFVADI